MAQRIESGIERVFPTRPRSLAVAATLAIASDHGTGPRGRLPTHPGSDPGCGTTDARKCAEAAQNAGGFGGAHLGSTHGPTASPSVRGRPLQRGHPRRPQNQDLLERRALRDVRALPDRRRPAVRLALPHALPDAEPLPPSDRDAGTESVAWDAAPERQVRAVVQLGAWPLRPRL